MFAPNSIRTLINMKKNKSINENENNENNDLENQDKKIVEDEEFSQTIDPQALLQGKNNFFQCYALK